MPGIKETTFEVKLRRNDIMIGNLILVLEQNCLPEKTRSHLSDVFYLDGLDVITGLPITLERCFIRK